MATSIEAFCSRWFCNEPKPSLIVLAGTSGTGKTHCAIRVSRWANRMAFPAMENGCWELVVPSVTFLEWPSVCDGFKSGEYGVLDDCFKAGMLVVDDVGAEHDPSRNAADKLCQLLSKREKKFTLITTNVIPGLWAERFDERISDRFFRNSTIVDLGLVNSFSTTSHP